MIRTTAYIKNLFLKYTVVGIINKKILVKLT